VSAAAGLASLLLALGATAEPGDRPDPESLAPADLVLVRLGPEPDAEQGSGPNLLLANPGDLLGGVVSIEYERALLPWLGVTLGAQAWVTRGVLTAADSPAPPFIAALGPELGVRFHPGGEAPRGAWVAAAAGVQGLLSRSDGPLARPWAWSGGLSAGYTFVLQRSLSFQAGVGARVMDYGDRVVWSPRLLLALGSAF
jgi:hypothetical protein